MNKRLQLLEPDALISWEQEIPACATINSILNSNSKTNFAFLTTGLFYEDSLVIRSGTTFHFNCEQLKVFRKYRVRKPKGAR